MVMAMQRNPQHFHCLCTGSASLRTSHPHVCAQTAGKQQELVVRAGVTQSVISAYESGSRQPAVPTLAALVNAAGYELVMDLRQQPGRPPARCAVAGTT
jgi:hypothetical protein